MSDLIKVRQLLEVALDTFDDPTASVSSNVRRAQRIAVLRRDLENQFWLNLEQEDNATTEGASKASHEIKAQLDTLLGPDEGARVMVRAFGLWNNNRSFQDENGRNLVNASSVGQIEQRLSLTKKVYADLEAPSNLTPIDTYIAAQKSDSSRAQLIPALQRDETILEKIKSSVHTFLVSSETELNQGQAESSMFLRAQRYIDESLERLAPAALHKFQAARDRLYTNEDEALSHALTSCRRMIKALADALYPATDEIIEGEDGRSRRMSDDLYRNRLLQYVREQVGKHTEGDVLQDLLDQLGTRLSNLDSLASKGVHDDVSVREAEMCVLWTYMLAGDLVRIADGSSAHLQDDKLSPVTPGAQ